MSGHTMILKTRGFTIVELMTAIALLAVIAALTVPSIGNLMRSNKLTAVSNDLFSSISMARSEAIKRKTDVTLEPIGNSWENGWRVVSNGNEIDTSKAIADGFKASTKAEKDSVIFGPNGYATTNNPWGAGDGVKFCDGEGKAKIVTVNTAGSIKVIDASC